MPIVSARLTFDIIAAAVIPDLDGEQVAVYVKRRWLSLRLDGEIYQFGKLHHLTAVKGYLP